MSYPGDYGSGMHPLLAMLFRTFRIGWLFGIEVRMYWTAAVVTPLMFLYAFGAGYRFALVLALVCSVLLFTIVWTHEMGHIVMARRYGIPTGLITLSPLGGVAHIGHRPPTPAAEIRIALAGPAVHLAWLAVFWPLQYFFADGLVQTPGMLAAFTFDVLQFLVWTNVGLLTFNLLPLFPLDGGRTARGLLSLRWHPNRVTLWVTSIGIFGGGLLALSSLMQRGIGGSIGMLIGLMCIQASLHERMAARHTQIYGGVQRHPWEGDPDAWKRGAHGGPPVRRSGPIARWRARRQEQQAERDRALDVEVDEILGRLHQVGMQGLSARDKALLKRASNRRRGAG